MFAGAAGTDAQGLGVLGTRTRVAEVRTQAHLSIGMMPPAYRLGFSAEVMIALVMKARAERRAVKPVPAFQS